MSCISNFQHDEENDSLKFKIENKDNNFDISLINSFRRIIIANLKSYAIDRDSVFFYKNNTIFNNDFLTQRLNLIPLNLEYINTLDISNLYIELNVKNLENNTKNITLNNFEVFYNDEKLNLKDIFPKIDILFCKLKENHELYFTCNVKLNTLKEGTSGNTLVSKAVYYFENDDVKLNKELNKKENEEYLSSEKSKKHFIIKNRERHYKTNDFDQPLVYCFDIESCGNIDVKNIFKMSCDFMINKLDNIIGNINLESDILEISKSECNMKSYDFLFQNEDDTLGNLLQSYILREKNIDYVGYLIPHPLDTKMLLRLSINSDNEDINKYLTLIKKILENVKGHCKKICADYSKLI